MAKQIVNVVSIHYLIGRLFRLEQKYPVSSKDQSRVHQLGTKSFLEKSLDTS